MKKEFMSYAIGVDSCNDEFPEILAIMIALNVTRPFKIAKRITEEVFDWTEKGEEDNDAV